MIMIFDHFKSYGAVILLTIVPILAQVSLFIPSNSCNSWFVNAKCKQTPIPITQIEYSLGIEYYPMAPCIPHRQA